MVSRAKQARRDGQAPTLTITLPSGEKIDLPTTLRDDGMPDLLTIAGVIEQRVRICRSERRQAAANPP